MTKKIITGTAQNIVDDYKDVCKKLNTKEITRNEYRENGVYSETLIDKIFDGFTNLKLYVKGVNKTVEKQEIDNNLEVTLYSYELSSVDELLSYSNIDTEKWQVDKQIVNAWGSEEYPCFQVKAWLSKKDYSKIDSGELLKIFEENSKRFVNDTKLFSPKHKKVKRDKIKNEEACMLEVSVLDLHLGQLSWGEETGRSDYDSSIAKQVLIDSVEYFVESSKGFKIDKILFPVGSDFFNSNDSSNSTYSGTPQDEDTRWQKTFMVGVNAMQQSIDILRQVADVEVVMIYGNHDFERSFHAGAYLEAWYRNDEQVHINNKPLIRKYIKYGQNLIGLTHGHDIKTDRLFMQMPIEAKELWSQTKYWEWHLGHLHHRNSKILNIEQEEGSLRLKFLPSLADTDSWHKLKGYSSIREAVSFVWSKEKGNIAQFSYHP